VGRVLILASLRTLLRGGRQRYARAKTSNNTTSSQPSTAHIRDILATHVASVGLTPSELLAVAEFYDLYSYPCDLAAGRSPLVGSIPTAHGRVAGRSTVAALVKSGTEKVEAALPAFPEDEEPIILQLEIDPVADRGWLEPDHLGFELSPTERGYAIEASMLAALDLVDRSSSWRDLSAALRNWAASHGVEPGPPYPLAKPRYEHLCRPEIGACALTSVFSRHPDSSRIESSTASWSIRYVSLYVLNPQKTSRSSCSATRTRSSAAKSTDQPSTTTTEPCSARLPQHSPADYDRGGSSHPKPCCAGIANASPATGHSHQLDV